MRDRARLMTQIADALPDIMRAVIESRPLARGEWELTLAQARALRVIGEYADCTMSDLARRLGISLSAATGLADRLVRNGVVEREGRPRDRRLVYLRLSRVGRRARAALIREKRRHMEAMLGHLSAEELNRIAEGLALLSDALGVAARHGGAEARRRTRREASPAPCR